MSNTPRTVVEAVSWDLTRGAARNLLGRLIIRGTSTSAAPTSIDHVGLIVFNRLYEFGVRGVLKRSLPKDEDPQPSYPAFKLRKREVVGTTTKTRQEVIEWVVNIKYGTFRKESYDLITHNCLDFVHAFCLFLRVPPLENWQRVRAWAIHNRRYAEMFQHQGIRSRSIDVSDDGEELDSGRDGYVHVGFTRSASLETLPPSYEEACGYGPPRRL